MSTFSFLSNIFGASRTLSKEDQSKLFEEFLLLTLSRASRSDLSISAVEVSKIQLIFKESIGTDVSEQDIRTAGSSELYEVAPLEKYAASAAKSLTTGQRHMVVKALYKVIGADGKFTAEEAEFFNGIANAMQLTPIEFMGAEIDGADV